MKWATCILPTGKERTGVVVGDEIRLPEQPVALLDLLAADADLDDEERWLSRARGTSHPLADVTLRAPLAAPPSVRDCLSYLDHIRNCRRARGVSDRLPDEWSQIPAFYFANPASVLGVDETVECPPGCLRFDLELEIAVVVGTAGRNIAPEDAPGHIAGYLLYCDWSARDLQDRERVLGIGQGQSKDCATTLGPYLVTRSELRARERPDGLDIDIRASVNGHTLVSTTATGMYWSFADLIAYTSRGTELRPGDVIGSGTVPFGCLLEHSAAPDFPGWLRPGDTVRIDGGVLGRIEQTIAPPPTAPAWAGRPARLTKGTTT